MPWPALSAWSLSSALSISPSGAFAPGCAADFGRAASTLPPAWNQQRCSRMTGNTARMALQKPNAPSPIARTGAAIPRRLPSRNR